MACFVCLPAGLLVRVASSSILFVPICKDLAQSPLLVHFALVRLCFLLALAPCFFSSPHPRSCLSLRRASQQDHSSPQGLFGSQLQTPAPVAMAAASQMSQSSPSDYCTPVDQKVLCLCADCASLIALRIFPRVSCFLHAIMALGVVRQFPLAPCSRSRCACCGRLTCPRHLALMFGESIVLLIAIAS